MVIKNILVNNCFYIENFYDSVNYNCYYVSVVLLLVSGNVNNVVGVVYMWVNFEGVYLMINLIFLIYLLVVLIMIVLGLGLVVLIFWEIIWLIEEMCKQILWIVCGDFFGQVKVMGNDELG